VQTCIVDGMNAINTPFALNFINPLVSAPENVRKYLYRQNALQTHILDGAPGDFCTVMLLCLSTEILTAAHRSTESKTVYSWPVVTVEH